MATAMRVQVTGRVQGVSFRMHAQKEARRLGVAGWVRNEPDGSVLLHVEGEQGAVDDLVAWCRQGPTGAQVADVGVCDASLQGDASFEVAQ